MTIRDYETEEPIDPSPCQFCTGSSAVRHPTEDRFMTSEEWCKSFEVCASTIDWEKVYGRNEY